jgi:hypothetical protein
VAPSVEATRRAASPAFRWWQPAAAILLFIWFVYCNRDTLAVPFAEDDMMNMANYWRPGWWWLAYAQIMPWRGYYRPLAGLLYMPLFHFFGLNPAPFHAAMVAVLAVNVWVGWRFARELGCPPFTAWLAALVLCYHPGMGPLYSSFAFIYDALCFTFYIGAFVYYMQIRREGRVPNWRELAIFLALFQCALNAKEMALTLPLMLLIYEWIYYGRPYWKGVIASGVLNLAYLYGKAAGVDPLLNSPAYRPVFSMHRFWVFHKGAFGALLGEWAAFEWVGVGLTWLALLYLALRRDRKELRFCWWFMFLTPLPIEFLIGRGQACLYVTLAAWAVFGAVVFRDVAEAIARFLSREPVGRPFRESQLFAAVCVVGIVLWGINVQRRKKTDVKPLMEHTGPLTMHVIERFREFNPQVPHGTTVVFRNDPFVDWDMAFIAELWFHDHTLNIKVARKIPMSEEEIASAGVVFDWRDDRLVQLKPVPRAN